MHTCTRAPAAMRPHLTDELVGELEDLLVDAFMRRHAGGGGGHLPANASWRPSGKNIKMLRKGGKLVLSHRLAPVPGTSAPSMERTNRLGVMST